MKNKYVFLSLLIVLFSGIVARAQVTISTTGFLNNNGSSCVTFNFVNNNATPVQITDLAGITGGSGANTGQLWYKPGAIAGPPGQITVANGWTMHASQAFTGVANTTTTATQPMLTGMSLVIPAGATYGLCYNCNNLRYSTIPAGTYTFSGGGCDIVTGSLIGYGGTLTSPTNTPRGFLGSITFVSLAPCAGQPSAGTGAISSSAGCPNANFNLSSSGYTNGAGITFQWQSAPTASGPWSNIVAATTPNYTTSAAATTFYQLIVNCTNSGLIDTTNIVSYTVTNPGPCVCSAYPIVSASSVADEDLGNVTVGSMTNTTTCASVAPGPGSAQNLYSNYTGSVTPATVQIGSSVSFSLSSITCGGNFGNGFQIYIDYNQNGSFADPGEQAYTSPASSAGPHTDAGSFTVPVTALVGVTRMRVVVVETTFPTATNYAITGYTWGETEDYCIDLIAPVACSGTPAAGTAAISSATGCPNASFNLSATGYTVASGISFQWESAPAAIGPWTPIVGATNATYSTSAATTTFYRMVITCSNSAATDTTNTVSFTVNNPGPCVCSSYLVVSASSVADEDLGNVTVGTLNNTTTCASIAPGVGSIQNRYSNYAGSVAPVTVTAGNSLSFSLSSITCGGNFGNGFQIHIDYNADGDFGDPGEDVYSSPSSSAGPHTETGSFTVPITATPGLTRMRVVVVETTFPTATNYAITGYTWGETEDYCIDIVPPPPIDMSPVAFANPLTTGCYSAADSVVVTVTNFGSQIMDFGVNPMTVNVSVTGPNAMSFTPVIVSSGTLAIAASMNVVISTTYNMSAAGTYGFTATTTVTGDGNTSNDGLGPVSYTFSAGTAMAGGSGNVCSGAPGNVSLNGMTPSTGTIQWQESTDNVTWTNIIGQTSALMTAPVLDTTYYRAIVCGLIFSVSDTVFTIDVAPPVATNDTICGYGTPTLTATGTGVVQWFDAQTAGTLVDTGAVITPNVTATDTFWVESTFQDCGAAGTPIAPICYPAYTNACSSADFINSFSTTGGSTNITNLATGCNGPFPSNTTFFPGQAVTTIPGGSFNLSVQSGASWGQGFRMWIDYNSNGDFSDPGEDVWNSGTSSTAIYTGTVVVPANTTPGPKRVRIMCRFATVPVTTDHCNPVLSFGEVEEYTLNVCTMCSSPRVASVAVVNPAPVVSVTSTGNICGSGTATLVASSPNPAYGYTWTPAATLNTPSGDTVIASPSTNTTYVVVGLDPATGCVDSASVSVLFAVGPAITATVSQDTVCANDTVNLSAPAAFANPVIVGTNDVINGATVYPAPYGQFYWGSRHQMLILASELTALGMTPGYLSALTFEIPNINGTDPLTDFEIKMALTGVTSITTMQAPAFTSVFYDPAYMPTAGLNTHTFSVPFYWDGTSNIIVETCHNNVGFTNNCSFRQTFTPFSSTVWYREDAGGVCANNGVTGSANQRPIMRLWKSTQGWQYAWNPVASLSNPNIENPFATPPSSTTYIVVVTDSVSGCTGTDSIDVFVNPNPTPSFGPDTSICSNTTLVLDGTAGPYTYLWQDSTVQQTFAVNSFGLYNVAVTDSITGCFGTDTILVGIDAAPAFTLGADATVCAGTQVSFSGPSGQYEYLWSTLDSLVSITTGTAGAYELAVTDTVNGCTSMDTVNLTVNPIPSVALGADTSVCSASGALNLSAPAGNFTYAWSTLDSVQSISVNSTGTYYVVVTDTATTCYSGDTITVIYNASPVAALGSDTTFCSTDGPITLVGPAGPYNYLWSDFSTGMTLQTNASGSYVIGVTDTISGCTSNDTIVVNVPVSPAFTLADTSFCGSQYTINGPVGSYGYMWSTGDTTSSITVLGPGGSFTLTVTDLSSGCDGTDSSIVNINASPTVTATASSTTPCADDANVILTGSPAGGTFTGTSVTGNQFDPSIGGGSYLIIYNFTDVNGCSGSDTVGIDVSPCVGINEPFVAAGMNVYPNPNSGMFVFTAADQNCQELTIEIMTVEGQVIQTNKHSNVQGNFTEEVDMTEFANGVYIMRVTTDGAVYTQRIVKQD